MKSTKNLTIILTICLAIIIAVVIIVACFKQQDVKYINNHIGSFEAETIQSHDKLKLQSGTYTINDYKPNGKELADGYITIGVSYSSAREIALSNNSCDCSSSP